MSASAASASASAPRAHASRRTSSRSHRVAASTPSSAASRRRRERAASASSTSSDSTPSAPSALATGAAWDDAWGSIADDPDTRVAYVDDADRDSLRATLAASSLREALAGADVGETIVSGVLSTSAPIDVRGVLNLPRELLRDSDHYSAALPGLEAIERDVAAIVERYGVIARARSARVHVSLLRRTLCSKFHVDHVPLRVMVTYFGAGTEARSLHWSPYDRVGVVNADP
ncbi:uncharacterized protein MICPUCDRAFT_49066 [Micromonas pusilla CCMP1545]|uniref:Predicted protein n=1 Tax=Micromonas pusilla (strain CCMP1545) TaxID=564608 RepID=C1N7T4_MICPC|nr:uncharacterized protein MICPUCDRAFT_49066 [Micromonas pusilla CCMP1545]EEH51769.1 predicted protein [Micromonas pusilla CCMP1545]|eukprot:XP_003064147.1 predicted protein [Micromonas pusilla CCMP1545]